MNIGIENDSHFVTHLYQTSSKSSLKSRLQILETLKISCFLKTTELNIDAFSVHLHLIMDLVIETGLLVLKLRC